MLLANDSHPKHEKSSAAAELARKVSALKQSSQGRFAFFALLLIGQRNMLPNPSS
ncbi:MAG: hypothetical protein V8R08_01505 [Coriobacteriales bacterium]